MTGLIFTVLASVQAAVTVSPTAIVVPGPNTSFSQVLTANGGLAPYVWQILPSPTPPAWLSISLVGGVEVLSGTPPNAGSFSATIEATGNDGSSIQQMITLLVNFSGTVITGAASNLPAGMAIVNISATPASAAGANGATQVPPGTSGNWSQPYNTQSQLLAYTIPAGTYTMRVIDPADAASIFPSLTQNQLSGIWTASTSTIGSPDYLTTYLVFASSAASNSSQTQLFSGADNGPGTTNPASAYTDAVNGFTANNVFTAPFFNEIRNNGTPGNTYTFNAPTTLIFTLPVYPPNSTGGVSVLIAPSTSSPSITTASLPPGQVNAAYSQTLTPTGGSGIYNWAATGLPPGLSLSSTGTPGALSGTPTHTGSYPSIQITVTDSVSGLSSTTTFSINIAPPSLALSISPTTLPAGEGGVAYSTTLTASGGYGAYTWSISAGAPLSLNPNGTTATLSSTGALATSGSLTPFTVTVMDTAGDSLTTQPYTVTVDSTVTITTSSLPNAAANESYATTLAASGGAGAHTWTATGLPAWLKLASATGILSGVAPNAGTYPFSVTATDSLNTTNTVSLSLVVTLPIGYMVENATSGGLVLAQGNGSTPTAQATVNGYDAAQDAGGNVVVATGTGLQRITPGVGSGNVSAIAGAPSGSSWAAVAVDPFGNLIAGDNKMHAIWRVSPDGAWVVMLTTYPTSNQSQQEDIRILVDVHGNYIVAEDNGSTVSLFNITPAGARTNITLTGATLPQSVGGLTFDQSGNYMLLDSVQEALFQITPQGAATLFTATGVLGSGTSGLARNPLTNQYVLGFPGQLKEIPAGGGPSVTTLVGNAQLATPAGVVALTEDFPSTVDATNPLAYFRLETSSGTSEVNGYTYSLAGNAPVSISSPGAPIGNPSNNFALLDGSSGEVTTNLAGNIATAGSIMAWVNLAALPSSTGKISYIAGESAQSNDFDLQIETDNSVHFYTTCCNNSLSYKPSQATLAGQWHMVAATFDATAGARAIYWDGVLVKNDNIVSQTNKTGQFWIGNTSLFSSFGNRYFNGGIDEAAVWNYALTAPQVYRMFASRPPGTSGTINSFSPASAALNGSATTLTISGQNLGTGSTVWWTSPAGQSTSSQTAGSQTTILTPSSVTAGNIVVTIPSALLTTTGAAEVSVANSAGVPGNQLPFTVAYPPLSISPVSGTLPGGQTNQLYFLTLTAAGGSGSYSWSIASQTAGLNMGPPSAAGATFNLIGTPQVANAAPGLSLIVTLTDTTTGQQQQAIYLIPVISTLSMTPSTTSIATAIGGFPSASISVSGGQPPYTFSIGGQPAGVNIGSGGSLSGSPTQAGTFYAVVSVTDSAGTSAATPITINVLGVTTSTLPNGMAGQFYSGSVGATGGTSAYSFSATGLPSGLSMSSSGSLTGTTQANGTFTISVTVASGGLSATSGVSLTIAKPLPLSISSTSLLSATVSVPYSQSFSGTGGVPPYTWTVNSGSLPQGLSMSASGIISGTPVTVGTVSFGVQATDAAGAIVTATTSIVIKPAPLTITTQTLPSGMNGVDYPQQTLTASGGISPYTWTISTGSALPSNMSLSSGGIISGIPGSAGTFSVGITVTDSASPATKTSGTLSLVIRPAAPDLILTSGSLAFALSVPASTPPASQSIGVQATVATQHIGYSVSVSPAAPWLSLTNGTTTPDSIQVSITSAALALTAGDYQTTITATCTSTACMGHTQTVSVDLKVTATPAMLQVDTGLLSFATTAAATGSLSQPIVIENTGGGTIGFTSVSCETAWCTASAPSGNVGGGASVSIPVTVNPSLLPPGFYRTQVDIATSAGIGSVPVTLFIAANSSMTLAPAGQQFNMPAGSAPGNPNGSFLVSVNNSTPVNWSAAVLPGSNWLLLGTPSGTSSSTQPGTASFSIDPVAAGALSPGAFYGRVEITSPDVTNSPQDFEVVLNVTPAAAAVPPDLEPGGLLFITSAAGVLPPETVTVYSGSVTPLTFQASATTNTGRGWLSVTPPTGTASANAPGVTTVSVDTDRPCRGRLYRRCELFPLGDGNSHRERDSDHPCGDGQHAIGGFYSVCGIVVIVGVGVVIFPFFRLFGERTSAGERVHSNRAGAGANGSGEQLFSAGRLADAARDPACQRLRPGS